MNKKTANLGYSDMKFNPVANPKVPNSKKIDRAILSQQKLLEKQVGSTPKKAVTDKLRAKSSRERVWNTQKLPE